MISVFGFGPDTDKSKVENETLQFRARARENFGNPSYVDGGSYVCAASCALSTDFASVFQIAEAAGEVDAATTADEP
jgi:hypothetical protein